MESTIFSGSVTYSRQSIAQHERAIVEESKKARTKNQKFRTDSERVAVSPFTCLAIPTLIVFACFSDVSFGGETGKAPNSVRPVFSKRANIDHAHNNNFTEELKSLASQWREAVSHETRIEKKLQHPIYMSIADKCKALGGEAIAALILENKARPYFWHALLESLTNANPVSSDAHGQVLKMAEQWYRWGVVNAYVGYEDHTTEQGEIKAPRDVSASFDWIEKVYGLLANKRPHAAADLLFEAIDDSYSEENFARVDAILRSLNLERLDENLMASVLAITFPARDQLSFRAQFFENVKLDLAKRLPDRVDKILHGLA